MLITGETIHIVKPVFCLVNVFCVYWNIYVKVCSMGPWRAQQKMWIVKFLQLANSLIYKYHRALENLFYHCWPLTNWPRSYLSVISLYILIAFKKKKNPNQLQFKSPTIINCILIAFWPIATVHWIRRRYFNLTATSFACEKQPQHLRKSDRVSLFGL